LEAIDGVVERVRFHNAASGFTVLIATVNGETQTLQGELATHVEKGARFSAIGQWYDDRKYGRQFRFASLEVEPPSGNDEVIARLKTYPGIGQATAERIVEQLGDRTWETLDTNPGTLRHIPGIGPKALAKIKEHHARQGGPLGKVRTRLITVGAPQSLARHIYDAYGDRALEMLDDYPYRVAAKVERFGFRLAERFARSTGLDPENADRVEAGVVHALRVRRVAGHCCMPARDLTRESMGLLSVSERAVDDAVERLLDHGSIRYQHEMVFLAGTAVIEGRVAQAILSLTRPVRAVLDASRVPSHLSEGQREAVEAVAASGVTILTGGPGTGKSTVVGAVIEMAERAGIRVTLCAPTGRAAKRITEATGREASTIHRLLRPIAGSLEFYHGRANPLPVSLVVVDEVSMLDLELADSLLGALTADHRLLLVGDADQLPSIGHGNLLTDLIDAAEDGANIALVRLDQIFRQAQGSTIIANARRILAGLAPISDTPTGALGQFYTVEADTPEDAQAKIIRMTTERIAKAYGLDPRTDVQILCPVHRGHAGVEAFNGVLQRLYNNGTRTSFWGAKDRRFCVADRVMQIRNDYERNVFNGDIGTVSKIDGDDMIVDFDGAPKSYKRFDLGLLQLAYAMTIHKSQGGEFPAVLIPVLRTSWTLDRQLLYTAVTRARDLCILTGHVDAIQRAAETLQPRRWTRLTQRILTSDG